MEIRPTIKGMITIQAVGPGPTIDDLIESIDGLEGWEIASEIDNEQLDIAEQATLLLQRSPNLQMIPVIRGTAS